MNDDLSYAKSLLSVVKKNLANYEICISGTSPNKLSVLNDLIHHVKPNGIQTDCLVSGSFMVKLLEMAATPIKTPKWMPTDIDIFYSHRDRSVILNKITQEIPNAKIQQNLTYQSIGSFVSYKIEDFYHVRPNMGMVNYLIPVIDEIRTINFIEVSGPLVDHIDKFDINICKIAYDYKTGNIIAPLGAVYDIANGEFHYSKTSLYRIQKYETRGFHAV